MTKHVFAAVNGRNAARLIAQYSNAGEPWANRHTAPTFHGTPVFEGRGKLLVAPGVEDADYWIYSYATPVAWRDHTTGEWIHNQERYSVTTSKHTGRLWAL